MLKWLWNKYCNKYDPLPWKTTATWLEKWTSSERSQLMSYSEVMEGEFFGIWQIWVMGAACHTHREPRSLADVWGVRMYAFCIFLHVWVQLRAVLCIHPVFLVDATVHKQTWDSHCALLFPNPSISLEQVHIFKTSIITELTLLWVWRAASDFGWVGERKL